MVMANSRLISCTLLIRPDLLPQVVGPARIESLLESLLLRHEWQARGRQRGRGITAKYQKAGSCLQKVAFRVDPVLWYQLGCYARVLGVSRCCAFALLLEADAAVGTVDVGTLPGKRWRKNWRRQYLLYYEIVGLGMPGRTVLRRRKYVDDAWEARMKRMFLQFEDSS